MKLPQNTPDSLGIQTPGAGVEASLTYELLESLRWKRR